MSLRPTVKQGRTTQFSTESKAKKVIFTLHFMITLNVFRYTYTD